MTGEGLARIEPGRRVFVDSSIFIYHFLAASEQCRVLLRRCECQEVSGVTSAVVLAEVLHRLMMLEAVEANLVSPGNVAKKLRAKPDVVRQLRRYEERVARIPLMGIQILPFDLTLLLGSTGVRRQHGLLTNDSLVATSARLAKCDSLATGDADLERVEDLSVFRPTDLQDEQGQEGPAAGDEDVGKPPADIH